MGTIAEEGEECSTERPSPSRAPAESRTHILPRCSYYLFRGLEECFQIKPALFEKCRKGAQSERLEHPKMFIWIHSFSHIFVLRKPLNTALWFPRHWMNGPGLLSGSSHCIASYTGREHTGPQEGQKYAMLSPSSRPVCGGLSSCSDVLLGLCMTRSFSGLSLNVTTASCIPMFSWPLRPYKVFFIFITCNNFCLFVVYISIFCLLH